MIQTHAFNRIPALAALAVVGSLVGCAPAAAATIVSASPAVVVSAATPTPDLGPTPLPPPTQAQAPDATPTSAPPEPGIAINPQTGEPGDVVMVTGTGWPANVVVSFHWGPPSGPTGPLYFKLSADPSGAFSVGLIVPLRSEWPTYLPAEFTILQLRATTASIIGRYYWASFTYVPRPTPVVKVAKVPTATVTCPTCW